MGVTEGPALYDHMAVGLLQGLSAGTILYVVIFEVLQREKTKRKVPGLVQLALIVVGFIIMICIEVTSEYSMMCIHDHCVVKIHSLALFANLDRRKGESW